MRTPADLPNTDNATTDYPFGRLRNDTVQGDNTGTPVRADWLSDIWYGILSLFVKNVTTPNGNAETTTAGQLKDIIPTLASSNTFTAVSNVISGHQLTNGGGLELNYAGTGDRNAYIDFHSADSPADYSTRIIRNPGVNGILQIMQTGTGGISIEAPVVYLPYYTMLGPNDGAHPAIRKKLLTTTFPSGIATFTLAHGLTLSKILSVVVVVYTGVYIIPPSYNNPPAYYFTWYSTAGDITINPSDSANLYGGTVKVMIDYIE